MNNRVVITGLGTVNPIGNDINAYWDGLLAGKSAVTQIDKFDVSEFTTKIAAQISNFDVSAFVDKKEARRLSEFVIYAYAASKQAIDDSGVDVTLNPEKIGVEIGSGIGGIEVLENASKVLLEKGPTRLSPFTVPMMICDMASGYVAINLGAKGPNSCSVTACASSAHSMINAYNLIKSGQADVMITGGSEACITPLGLASFCAARSLSTRNDQPELASSPFDLNRDGFVMGEGAGILVFESLDSALSRGAKIYSEVVGFGTTGDAYHITAPAPEGEGASRALELALDMAQINKDEVDYINAHGTSTKLNDKNETAAIKTVFGEAASNISISSTKSMTGHLLGATGAIELIAGCKAMENSVIPPTINLNNPDPDCDLDYTPNSPKERDVNVVLSNSFGFGGHNAVLAIKKYK